MSVRGTRWLLPAALLLVPSALVAQAQVGTVVGTVRSTQTQQPIASAQVSIAGTNLGAVTGQDGRFRILNVPAGPQTLSVRRIGFDAHTRQIQVPAGDTVSVTVDLATAVISLDQVIVTGSAVATSRREVGTSIGTVDSTLLRNTQAASVDQALQGKLAGVQVTQNSGNPGGGGITVRMRGTSSIISGSDPLYIVDGVIVDNSSAQLRDLGARSAVQNRLADINPADIERIEVIRGAAAAALYGSRANNGVVQIFTKRGSAGRPRFTLNVSAAQDELPTRLGMNLYPFDANGNPVQRFNYQDLIFRRANTYEANLSIAGGTDATTYYVSAGVRDQAGIVNATDAQRRSVRLNLGQELAPTLRLDVGANYVLNESNFLPNGERPGGVITSLVFAATDFDFRPDEFGVYPIHPTLVTSGFANPLLVMDRFRYPEETNRFIGNARLRWTPLDVLSLDYNLGFDTYQLDASEFIPRGALLPPNQAATGLAATAIRTSSIVNQDLVGSIGWGVGDALALRTSAGVNYTYQRLRTTNAASFDLPPTVELISGATPAASQGETEVATLGFYGEQAVTWRDVLTLTGALRADAASNFGANERWQYYPKLQVSYVLGDEPAFRESSLGNVFSALRLRAAIGYAGNQPSAANAYSRFDVYEPFVNSGRTGLVNSVRLGNEDLKPERQREFEAGIDFGVLNGRVNAEVTYYDKLVSDLLLFRPLAPSTGYTTRFDNIGEMSNKGWELLLNTQNVQNDRWGWSTTITYSRNRNRVEKLDVEPFVGTTGYPNRVEEGQPLGVFYGQYFVRNADGSIQLDSLGLPRRSGLIPELVEAGEHQRVIGDPNPDWTGSLLNEFNIGENLRFRILFDGTFGNDVMNLTRRIQDIFGTGTDFERELLPFGDPRKLPNGWAGRTGPLLFEDYVEDGSFVKLRELAVTYNFTQPFVTNLIPGGVEVTLSGRNLYTWSDYTGFDPELNLFGQNTVGRGFDFATYPIPRTWAISARFSY